MSTLTRQRCWIHLEREAAARCPVCTRFYCRECVTEHEGKVVCAACLRDALAATANARRKGLGARGRRVLAGFTRTGQLAGSIVLAWVFFGLLGGWLLTTATQFHESNVWAEQFFGGGSENEDGFNQDRNDQDKDDDEDENEDADQDQKNGGKSGDPKKKDDDSL